MKQKSVYASGVVLLAALVTLVVWQGSFSFGDYGPSSPQQTYLLWAVSTLVFLLTVTLGFMLFRTAARMYIERQSNRAGSRIRFKLVVGALALSFTPVFFLVVFSVYVLNRNLDKWFSRPAENISLELRRLSGGLEKSTTSAAAIQASWLASLPEVRAVAAGGALRRTALEPLCRQFQVDSAALLARGGPPVFLCGEPAQPGARYVSARAPVAAFAAEVEVAARLPVDLAAQQAEIQRHIDEYNQLKENKKFVRNFYILLLVLITLFVLFFATWIALFLARQISIPIAALLNAATQLRRGNLSYRVQVTAIDELATLVRAFNQMTEDLEANSRELERRRRFTEAILESIPTGVISIAPDGTIQRVNHALKRMFSEERVARANRLEDLFPRDDTAEIRYLMKRARRTGAASRQMELTRDGQILHLSVTAAALEERINSGFVLVIEDTSELLRAQREAAWHEVARRVAHEIKNPLTPISLCSERLARQLDRVQAAPETARILRDCSSTISREVESVRTLVDEFSQFARFPSAHPVPGDLNTAVEDGLAVFAGRLDGIRVHKRLAPNLPAVNIDREQFKRVVVNLVDNAAEAMQESLVKELFVVTQAPSPDAVELIVSDTGAGISPEDKEKLFLPYFSTKGRGTGLGLAIVNHILSDHNAHIRVEDNRPVGARFIVELPAAGPAVEAEPKPAESRA